MSENDTQAEATTSENTTETQETETQETDWKANARTWEQRAKANETAIAEKDAAVEKVSTLETQVSELEAYKEETSGALEAAEANVLRYKLALKHGLDEEDLELFLTASDEETLEKQAQRISERNSAANALRPDPAQGRRTGTGTPSTREAFAQAFEGQI